MKKEVTNVYQYIMTFTSVLKKRKLWRYIYGKFKLNANTNSNLLHTLITKKRKKHWNRVFISVLTFKLLRNAKKKFAKSMYYFISHDREIMYHQFFIQFLSELR